MDLVYIIIKIVKRPIKEIIIKGKKMVKELISMHLVINTLDHFQIIKNMDMERLFIHQEAFMKVLGVMIMQKDMEL